VLSTVPTITSRPAVRLLWPLAAGRPADEATRADAVNCAARRARQAACSRLHYAQLDPLFRACSRSADAAAGDIFSSGGPLSAADCGAVPRPAFGAA